MLKANPSAFTEEQNRAIQHFNALSDYWYDVYQGSGSYTNYALQKQHHVILEAVQHTAGARRILDVGCGAGVTALALAELGYEVSGLDIAPKMIERAQTAAQEQGVACDFRVGTAEALPYPDESYDVLIALGLLGNILNDEPALKEMVRVLKPGGRLLATVPNILAFDLWMAFPKSVPIMLGATRFRQSLRQIGNIGRRLTGRSGKAIAELRFNQCVVPRTYARHIAQHGFRDVRYSAVTFGPTMPFGLRVVSAETSIRISESLAQWVDKIGHFNGAGTIIVYDGWRV